MTNDGQHSYAHLVCAAGLRVRHAVSVLQTDSKAHLRYRRTEYCGVGHKISEKN